MRTLVYNKYKELKKSNSKKLLKQQIFLANYIYDNYDNIDKMLLFHGIGTGKTCTSIAIAETIMNMHKNMKVLVILPARLKTNFLDELMSNVCNYNNNDMKLILSKYQIISYEKLRNILTKSTDYKETIAKITKNKIVIVDEVHNLLASNITNLTDLISEKKIPPKTENINAMCFRLFTKFMDKSSKLFCLSASPIFDNYFQFIQLILNLRPDLPDNIYANDLKKLVNYLKGKVTFYKLNDLSKFPKKDYDNINIPMNELQYKQIKFFKKPTEPTIGIQDNGDVFCVYERQYSISLYNIKESNLLFKNLKLYAPKIHKFISLLKLPGKHVVFSNFIDYCLKLIALYLEQNGWTNYVKKNKFNDYKTFIIWDASLSNDNKQKIKQILNSPENMDGKMIRLVLGSPSIKEGVSFKHIQHLHQIDPVWNPSAKEQIEGRCIRYESHEEIPINHPTLKRKVIIHNYILVSNGFDITTCDSNIYDVIIPNKIELIELLNKVLHKISFDYYLWDDTIKPNKNKNKKHSYDVSVKSYEDAFYELVKKKRKPMKKIHCPKPRRPILGVCEGVYPVLKINKHDEKCCYKK